MALSTQRAVSDGTLVLLAPSIKYFDRTEIEVFFNGVLIGENVVAANGSKWNWLGTTDNNIAFTPAIPNGVEVMVKRSTTMVNPRHEYTKGAKFVSETLDENFHQVLRIVQEAKEGSTLTEIFNDLDVHGFQIKNLGVATQPNHPVSLSQYQADAAGASVARVAAEAARDVAVASKVAAAASEGNALASKNAASASEVNALASKNAASASEANALSYRNAASASQIAAAASYDAFDDRYLGSKTADPTLDNDGNALLVGALYYNSALNGGTMLVYTGTAWKAAGSAVNGTAKRLVFSAATANAPTAGQTVFSITGGYDPTFADVYLNGIKMVNGQDVTVTSGTDVVFAAGVETVDVVEVVCYGAFEVVNHYTKGETYTKAEIDGIPMFSAFQSAAQTALAHGVFTALPFNAEEYDTHGFYDIATGRFQPTAPGYYRLSGAALFQVSASGKICLVSVFKNGVEVKRGGASTLNAGDYVCVLATADVYLNGTTDYAQLGGYQSSGAALALIHGAASTYFQGHLVRRA